MSGRLAIVGGGHATLERLHPRVESAAGTHVASADSPRVMSVACTKEEDSEAAAAHLPDLPISPHPNLVTASGLEQIEARLLEARAAYAAAQGGDVRSDRTALARATRDLRYWSARRGSARLTPADPGRAGAQFGSRVTFLRADGRTQSFRIVGEDEADPNAGAISYVSPLARALLGREPGDEIDRPEGALEVLAVETP